MISSIIQGLASFRKPLVLAPAIVVALFEIGVFALAIEPFLFILLDAINQNLPKADPLVLPFLLYQQYFGEINTLLLAWGVGLALQLWLLFVLSRYAKEQSVSKSVSYAWKRKGSVVATVIFSFLALFLAFSLYLLLSWIAQFNAFASTVLFILLFIVSLFCLVKLSFFVQSMALDEVQLKEGLKKSWSFSHKRFWAIVAFLIALWLIANAFNAIAALITQGILDETIAFAIVALVSVVGTTWTALSMGYYYQKKQSA